MGAPVKVFTTKKLAEMLECSTSSVNTYISRAEFSHVSRIRTGSQWFFKGVTKKDLITLAKIISARKTGKKKSSTCSKQKHGVK